MKKMFLCFALVLVLALTACGTTQKFPDGKFVSDKDANVYWQFNSDGTWDYRTSSGLPLEGTYTINGSTYTETFNNALLADADNCNKSATYTWSFDGSKLTFKTLSDLCAVRNKWYTSSTFVMAK